MTRTFIGTSAMLAMILVGSFFVTRTPAQGVVQPAQGSVKPAQGSMKPAQGSVKPAESWLALGGFRVQRFQNGDTCVVIVSRGEQFSAVPCR